MKKDQSKSGGNKGKGKSKGESKGKGNGNGHGVSETQDQEQCEGQGKGKGQGNGQGGSGSNQDGGEPPTLEELIASIKARNARISESLEKEGSGGNAETGSENGIGQFDDHSFWEGDDDGSQRDAWMNRMIEATDVIASIESSGKSRGTIPAGIERLINELKNPTLDWRTILNDFVQEEICDYSFTPPDKRIEDSPFFLPDFNEKDETAKNLLFMIDTSGSMSDEDITECYSEIYGAIQQFNGKLTGKLGFFDAVVIEPVPFEDEEKFKIIRPQGGGGTSFHIVFDYVREKMQDDLPVSIIILTDGYAPYPKQEAAMDIPVLWIINNKEAKAPKWGKIARMISEEKK